MTRLPLLIAVIGLLEAVRALGSRDSSPMHGTLLAFGVVVLAAFFASKVAGTVKLPKLTGYLALGMIVGPPVLGLLTEEMVQTLKWVNYTAVSLIALTAGGEISFKELRPLMKSIAAISGIAVVGTMFLLAFGVFVLQLAFPARLPFFEPLSIGQTLAVCLLLGVALAAQSPAVVVALLDETGADGPVSRTALGVVVLADILVIVVFAVAMSIAQAAVRSTADVGDTTLDVLWEVLGSMAAGALVGGLLAIYLRFVPRGAALFVIVVCIVIAEVGSRLDLDPLIVALTAGIVVRNLSSMAGRLIQEIEAGSLPLYVLFFAVAGAGIHLDALPTVAIPAVALIVLRSAGLLGGSVLASRLAGAPNGVSRFVGFGLLPQAGLALALADYVDRAFPEFRPIATSLIVTIIALNELIAPIAFRIAIVRSGEAGKKVVEPPQPISGVEQTLAAEITPP